ncbi:MAG: sigma-70 family RNA polymerase sigma factor [Clostridia bacterium]|nr:sigma-70 family RNA polymerase sigma factor [Clostridia bacterium]
METVKGPESMEERLERMVSMYQLSLLRLCYAYLHDEEMAKDAVQETFIKAYRHMDQFRETSSEKTWLSRIAINVSKDMRRSAWFKHVDRSITLDMLPESACPATEEHRNLTAEIMNLPPKLREAALLCWLQEMSYSEAAEALEITHQAVSGRLDRARRKLRKALERSEDHDPA